MLTHGNGPQIGLLALQSEAYPKVGLYPLDVLSAESEGMIGYLLDQAQQNELPGRQVGTLWWPDGRPPRTGSRSRYAVAGG